MARKLFEKQAVRRRNGQLANGVALVVYTDEAGTTLADISATSGGSAIAGSSVTTADIAGLGPASLRFWGPSDGADTLYMRVPSDASLGAQKIEADPDPRLDALEAAGAIGGIPGSVFDAKGDLIAASAADTATRLAVGADGYELTTDSATTTGLRWLAPYAFNVMAAPFNATGDGVTPDHPAVQAAVNAAQAAGGGVVVLPVPPVAYNFGGTVTVTARRIRIIIADGATILPTGQFPAFSLSPTDGSMLERIVLEGGKIDGNATVNQSGIYLGANSSGITIRDVSIRDCDIGLDCRGTQFSSFEGVSINSCTIGVRLDQGDGTGGGNNNTWQDIDIQGCTVGFMAFKSSVYPFHSNSFENTAFHANSLAAMYIENAELFSFTGAAHESNGEGGATSGVYYGKTVKRSTWHLVGTTAYANAWQNTTNAADAVILETASVFTVDHGGGGTFYPNVDATSLLLFGSYGQVNGRLSGLVQWPAARSDNGVQMLGEPLVTRSLIPNTVPNPRTIGLTAAAGGSSFGFDDDSTWGRLPYVQFAASAGSTSSNRGVFNTKGSAYGDAVGTLIACSMLIRASVDTSLTVDAWQSTSSQTHALKAGKAYRLVIIGKMGFTPRDQSITLYPADGAGAKVNVWNAHAFVAADPRLLASFVLYGWFNDTSLVQGREGGGLDYGSQIIDGKGSGTPEGVVTAAIGSTWRRTDGGAATSFYVKESGSGNTGWFGK